MGTMAGSKGDAAAAAERSGEIMTMTMMNASQNLHGDDEEQAPLNDNSTSLDERILEVVRRSKKEKNHNSTTTITVRPALLTSELGLSVEEATRELCGLLSAVGGGEDGASFHFERVEILPNNKITAAGTAAAGTAAAATATAEGAINNGGHVGPLVVGATTVMVFTFPHDFEERAKKYRRRSDLRHKLRILSIGIVKALKCVTAFGLIISLAVLLIIGICLLVAAVIALARGGGHGGGGGRNHPLMHKLQYLTFQLRQILWLYAICGSAVDGQRDPIMREIAGDIAMTMSIFCGNPVHPFFWYRLGSMRTRWARLRNRRGWGSNLDSDMINGVAMMRLGSWGQNEDHSSEFDRRADQTVCDQHQQRGLLSIAVEFLFGPSDYSSTGDHNCPVSKKELEKWKFRASIIISLSSKSPGSGVSLRELLPFVDNPPVSAIDPSAIRETLRIVSYFNGKPADSLDNQAQYSGIDAKFCFPELVAESNSRAPLNFDCSNFSPPSIIDSTDRLFSILYKEDEEYNFGSLMNSTTAEIPTYLYEQPFVLTELTQQQFGQCLVLGLLNFTGVLWALNSMKPGGLLSIPTADTSISRDSQLVAIASVFVLKLLHVLRFYAVLFLVLPLCRFFIVSGRNCNVQRRNKLRSDFLQEL